MKYLLAALCMLLSLSAAAGYKGQDPTEMSRTADRAGNGYYLYISESTPEFVEEQPVCAGRRYMLMQLAEGFFEKGCWWRVGGQIYGYTEYTGTLKFTMDLMLVNDNFTGKSNTGF